MKISITIIATSRSVISPECLASAHKLSEDVVIVTNADHKFVNYSDQKNYAVSLCKHDWVLSLDADEIISPELIHELITMDYELDAYKISRLNYIFGRPIWHSNWEPKSDTHIWLFNKHKAKWVGNVHEEIHVNGLVGKLTGFKIHRNYTSVEEFISKMNRYTTLEDKAINPFIDFFRRFIWHRGFLDGWHGLFLGYLMMIYHTTTWVKKKLS